MTRSPQARIVPEVLLYLYHEGVHMEDIAAFFGVSMQTAYKKSPGGRGHVRERDTAKQKRALKSAEAMMAALGRAQGSSVDPKRRRLVVPGVLAAAPAQPNSIAYYGPYTPELDILLLQTRGRYQKIATLAAKTGLRLQQLQARWHRLQTS